MKRSLAAQNEVSFHCLIQLVSTWLSLPKIQRGQVIVITSTNRNTFQKPKPGIPLHEFTSFQEIIQEENQEKCGYLFLEDFSVHDQKEIVSYLGTNLLTKSSIVIFTILPYETIVCRWKIKAQGIQEAVQGEAFKKKGKQIILLLIIYLNKCYLRAASDPPAASAKYFTINILLDFDLQLSITFNEELSVSLG